MTTPTLTPPPTPAPNKYGGDPVAFDAAMQARLDWQATATAEETAMVSWVNTQTTTVQALANAVQSDRTLVQQAKAAIDAQSPVTNAAAAAAAASAAAVYASQAQATNPDSPIRLNPSQITADFTVPANYNAASTGPITVADGVTVTVSDNATWSIT